MIRCSRAVNTASYTIQREVQLTTWLIYSAGLGVNHTAANTVSDVCTKLVSRQHFAGTYAGDGFISLTM